MIGLVVNGVSDAADIVATHADGMLGYCTIRNGEDELLSFIELNQFPGNVAGTEPPRGGKR